MALAALAGVMAAPIYRVNPLMGTDLIIVVFAVVVIGGMGSILGSIVTGFGLGVIEGLTKVFYPEASNTVVFVIMAIVLLVKPAGALREDDVTAHGVEARPGITARATARRDALAPHPDRRPGRRSLLVAPFVIYPVFLMKMLCFALFACAFNLLIGYVGLLSFGHALFFGGAGYLAAHAARVWGLPFELAVLTGTATGAVLRAGGRVARHPAAGDLLRDDHPGPRADVLLLLPPGAVHRRRGRHPGRAAREAPRPARRWTTT